MSPARSAPDFEAILSALSDAGVNFILIGGLAAAVHGAARSTFDVDVVYERGEANHERLVSAVRPLHPYFRGAPPGLPFFWDADMIDRGLNFTLTTDLGDLDLLGDIPGGGGFADLLEYSVTLEVFGVPCRCLGLAKLIHVKRAAGRPKDFEAIAELEAIWEEQNKG